MLAKNRLHSTFHEHAMDVHVPSDAEIDREGIGRVVYADKGLFTMILAVGEHSVEAHILAERRIVLETDAIFGNLASGSNKAIERGC